MTEHHTDENPAELEPEEARAAETNVGLKYVLGISVVAIIIVMAIVLVRFMAG